MAVFDILTPASSSFRKEGISKTPKEAKTGEEMGASGPVLFLFIFLLPLPPRIALGKLEDLREREAVIAAGVRAGFFSETGLARGVWGENGAGAPALSFSSLHGGGFFSDSSGRPFFSIADGVGGLLQGGNISRLAVSVGEKQSKIVETGLMVRLRAADDSFSSMEGLIGLGVTAGTLDVRSPKHVLVAGTFSIRPDQVCLRVFLFCFSSSVFVLFRFLPLPPPLI
jgi:hypothetical protein